MGKKANQVPLQQIALNRMAQQQGQMPPTAMKGSTGSVPQAQPTQQQPVANPQLVNALMGQRPAANQMKGAGRGSIKGARR